MKTKTANNWFIIAISVVLLIVFLSTGLSIQYNCPNEAKLVLQFGQVVRVVSDEGPFLIVPFIQNCKSIYTGDNMYDLPNSDVITSDKKSMTADAYSVWHVTDPLVFYQSVASESVAESRELISLSIDVLEVLGSCLGLLAGRIGLYHVPVSRNSLVVILTRLLSDSHFKHSLSCLGLARILADEFRIT